jgi:BirA family biotin operon repressor/biotin-[acetyl-CoA-carboxylase] ligase
MAQLNEESIREAMSLAQLPEVPVRYSEVTESTNATATELARRGAPEWTLVGAGHQTAGRGRLGRTWVSTLGSSLLFSIVLRPSLPPEQGVLLGLLAGTCMVRGADDAGASGLGCKWPNDLLIGDEKVGGILAEAAIRDGEIDYVVLGIGVNLGVAPDVEGAGAIPGVAALDLLTSFLAELWSAYEHGRRGPAARGFAARIVGDYRLACRTIGRRVRATTRSGRTVEGAAIDVDETGALVVETSDGRETVGFGEVQHLR